MNVIKKATAFILVLALMALAGCQSREGGEETSIHISIPEESSEGMDSEMSLIGEESKEEESEEESSESEESQESESSEDSAAAMSTDFSSLAQLDATKKGWGWGGGGRDEKNRPISPLVHQEKLGKYDAYFILPDSDRVYLTFDEGYEYGYTPAILDTLKEKNVSAVFFVTGHFVKTHPDLVRRMIDEGHVLGNHSNKHPNYADLPLAEAAKDLMALHEMVKKDFDYEMTLFRFPEGCYNEQLLALVQSLGYKSVFWSFAHNDWDVKNQPLTIEAQEKIVENAHPGAIYLLHAVSRTNTEVLGEAIDLIRAKGLEFGKWELA
ncbi:MAG: polysaccharide deacetylase family protein [Oscillospiraceae bacterium]